ncbi:MAG TPA: hypothetical protein QF753_17070 [Victivallales bacterium]|nr:hypothetical protein [Victivallales bacterium]
MFLLFRLLFRRMIILPILLILGIYYGPSYYAEYYLSDITGTKVTADVSWLSLFTGDLMFNDLTIYSSSDFDYVKAVDFKKLEININPWSFFTEKKVVNIVSADEIAVTSIYLNSGNNINTIINNVNAYFKKDSTLRGNGSCSIKELFLRNIRLRTYYYSTKPVVSRVPNIYLTDINTNSGALSTVSNVLKSCVAVNVNDQYENNISWWDKTVNGAATGFGFAVNAVGTGVGMANTVLGKTAEVQETIAEINESVSSF